MIESDQLRINRGEFPTHHRLLGLFKHKEIIDRTYTGLNIVDVMTGKTPLWSNPGEIRQTPCLVDADHAIAEL